ncbi:hypothetical protein T12_6156 [Trichinella patagoniensis]|uniref:Uncharacterized protein n=1 Tax=Trichinella patagoniensis TaxID=990121 RepID=A0A0V0ZE74_9BILA|nr:hypothetical protein T12_6156 [Trichinella patagoniensis]
MRIVQVSVVACIRLVISAWFSFSSINFVTVKPVYVRSVVKVAGTTDSIYFNPFARLHSFVCPQFENEKNKNFFLETFSHQNNTKNKPDKQTTRPSPIFVPTTTKTFFLPGLKSFVYLVRAHSTWPFFLHRSGRPGKVGEQIAQAKVQKNKQQQQQWTTIEHIGCRRVAIIRIAQADFLQGGSAERVQIIQMTLSFVQTHFLGFGLDVVTAERGKWHPYRTTLG